MIPWRCAKYSVQRLRSDSCPPTSQNLRMFWRLVSGMVIGIVATFWPTVGVIRSGGRCFAVGVNMDLRDSRNVVFPELSRPRMRIEYSGWVC
mgnify:CR=1 FL=1